jgi:hypothetical protein
MATVADLVESPTLGWTQARRSAGYHSLFHAGVGVGVMG